MDTDTTGIRLPSATDVKVGIVRRTFTFTGVGYIGVGIGWATTLTSTRLDGVGWLPADGVDEFVAGAWVVVGLLMIIAGIVRRRAVDTAAFISAILVPLGIGMLFLVAQITGEARTGWITAWSYAVFFSGMLAAGTYGLKRDIARVVRGEGSHRE